MPVLRRADCAVIWKESLEHDEGGQGAGYDNDGDLIVDSGIAFALDKNLQAFTQTGGIIASKTSLLNTRIGSSEKNIESLEKKLTQKEQDLKRKYGQMESVLNSLEKQSDSITNFNNNQGGGK